MRNLVIMPAMAQNRERMNLDEFAEEATIIMDEPVRPANHFIEANTQEVTLHHLKHDCITPVFSKDNELTINHAAFVETIQDAAQSFFSGERVEQADIRVNVSTGGQRYDIAVQCTDEYAGGGTAQAWDASVSRGMLSGSDAPG